MGKLTARVISESNPVELQDKINQFFEESRSNMYEFVSITQSVSSFGTTVIIIYRFVEIQ